VAGQGFFNLLDGGFGGGSQQRLGGHHETGGAPAALEGFIIAEALGDRRQIHEVGRKRLGGLDFLVGGINGEHHAGIHVHAIDKYGAVSAFTAVAADLGESEPHLFAQHEVKRPVGLDVHPVFLAVHVENRTGVYGFGDGGGDGGRGDGDGGCATLDSGDAPAVAAGGSQAD